MTIDTLIMLSGALIAVLPFLGFPNSWDNVLFFLAGVFVIALGVAIRRRDGLKQGTHQSERNFVENRPSLSAELSHEAPRVHSIQPEPLHDTRMQEMHKPLSATASALPEKKPHVQRTKVQSSSRLASVEPVISPVQRVAAPQAAPRTRARRAKAAAHEAS